MLTPATIGLDIAKNVFQVHGIDSDGKVLFRQQLKRGRVLAFFKKLKPCLIGIEACATSQGHGSLRSRLRAAATSGSKHRRCKVHSELAR